MKTIGQLRTEYSRIRRQGFDTLDVRDFVELTLRFVLEKPDSVERREQVNSIFHETDNKTGEQIIPRESFVGNDGVWIRQEGDRLRVTQGGKDYSLEDLCATESGKYPRLEKYPEYVWVDSGELTIDSLTRFLSNIPHLIITKLHYEFRPSDDPKIKTRYIDGVFEGAGKGGFCYASNMLVKRKTETWEAPKGHRVKFQGIFEGAGSQFGLFYGRNIDLQYMGHGFRSLAKSGGKAALIDLSLAHDPALGRSFSSAASNNGQLFIGGNYRNAQPILGGSTNNRDITFLVPDNYVSLYTQEGIQIICRTLAGHFSREREGFFSYSMNFFPKIIPGNHMVLVGSGPGDGEEITYNEYMDPIYRSIPASASDGEYFSRIAGNEPHPSKVRFRSNDVEGQKDTSGIYRVKESDLKIIIDQQLTFEQGLELLSEKGIQFKKRPY